ncbi:DNA mismatch repair protein MutS [Muricauda sp. JGD-17]|uniref:DNA mismatch repair protein MutS n=1 Tax=Flagellimonas ochracea TaxID=2696472 RepID=A0A964TD46_9FLAO|nr:DNA mismatch repair protein MutS [Allomuricauda ochracea]NAY92697.1 DNA mismatch repair protein MutS [Allomuricauda ochracea]
MEKLRIFYTQNLSKHRNALQQVKRGLNFLALLRLTVFLLVALSMYFFWSSWIAPWIFLLGLVVFLYLVSRYVDYKREKAYLERLVTINETELVVLEGRFHHLFNGEEFMEQGHPYAQDLDLFGRGSFYQYCNRTALGQGSKMLAKLLLDDMPADISKKQEAIKELSALPEWRQQFWALAGNRRPKVSHEVVSHWMKNHKPFVPVWMRYFAPGFLVISILLIVGGILGFFPESLILIWYLLGWIIVGRFGKKSMRFSSHVSQAFDTIVQYQRLLEELEHRDFNAVLLKEFKESLHLNGDSVSKTLKKFKRFMSMLEQQNNLMVVIFGQGLMLWTPYFVNRLEAWMDKYGSQVEDWFKAIAYFDAYNCLGNYAFNHPDHTYPKILKNRLVLEVKDLGHPLINAEKNVLNNFSIDRGRFSIITGANMAGKSTFLRAVALQIVMANVGLPVKGKDVKYTPVRLLTSMRSSDSLTDDTSYFYAELKRLKYIIDELGKGDCFVVLDEILKGTNSVDKAEGSKKFVERLVHSGTTGLVATHDLSLCELSQKLPQVENHYFDAQIVDGALYFDYKYRSGICQNMNASFLLKDMGIVD